MSTVEEFSRNALDLVVLMTFGIFYLYSFTRLKKSYLRRLGSTQNESITVLFLGGVVASAVNLVHSADAASDAILFFLEQNDPVRAFLYALCFFMAAWVLSFLSNKFLDSFQIIAGGRTRRTCQKQPRNSMAACHHSRGIDLCYCTGMGEYCHFVYSLPCIAILK